MDTCYTCQKIPNRPGRLSRQDVTVNFEWDNRKKVLNEAKHGVTFEEAITVFDNPLAVTFDDEELSEVFTTPESVNKALRTLIEAIPAKSDKDAV